MNREKLSIEYDWCVQQGLVGFEPFTQLCPWYFLKPADRFMTAERWPSVAGDDMIVFARKQDDDTLAAFKLSDGKVCGEIFVLNGWTGIKGERFDVLQRFDNFWDWLKSTIDDIALCVDAMPR
jgi:hypothetical protein